MESVEGKVDVLVTSTATDDKVWCVRGTGKTETRRPAAARGVIVDDKICSINMLRVRSG